MDVVRHQVSFLNPALLLACKFAKYIPKVDSQLAIQHLATAFWDEHDVVFAIPHCVAQTLELVHRGFLSSRVLGGSRGKVSTMGTSLNVKLLLLPRQSRGNSLGV